MADVELKNITKVYDSGNVAVKDITITIADKEFVVLVGPSGCGKSTTLRMIAGLEDITSGDIYINGKRVNEISPKNRDIAMVFQNYALYPHMTVFENMAFGLKLRKFAKQEVKDMVKEAARILDLEDYLERKPKALSGGQRQRVAVGRAIVRKPAVFLFDEPLSNLDAKLRVQMRTEISKLHNKLKATMIYVTHDQTEAMTMGDKIVLMKDGIVQQVDKPLNLYNHPSNKFVAGFIGSPSMNFFIGNVSSKGDFITSQSGEIKVQLNDKQKVALSKYEGKKVIVGIRPEDIHDMMDSNVSNIFVQINIILDVVEPMGNEIYLYFNLEGQPFVSRIPAREIPSASESKKLFINANKLHLFDPSTEAVITQ